MSPKTIIIIAFVWLLGLAVVVAVVYFMRESNKFQSEFGALTAVCQGRGAAVNNHYSSKPGTHPAIAVKQSGSNYYLDTYLVPSEALADSLEETQAVLCVGSVQQVFIESCPYAARSGSQRNKAVERYYQAQEVRLVNARTGGVVAQNRFTGSSPHYCHETEWFREDEYSIKLIGSDVSTDDIKRWAGSQLIIQ